MTHSEVTVRGGLSAATLEVIRSRFGEVTTAVGAGSTTTIAVVLADAAAERALLQLLWDTGYDVVAHRAAR